MKTYRPPQHASPRLTGRPAAGFTTLELIIVIICVLLLAGLVWLLRG